MSSADQSHETPSAVLQEETETRELVGDGFERAVRILYKFVSGAVGKLDEMPYWMAKLSEFERGEFERVVREIAAASLPTGGGRAYEIFVCPTCERQLHPLPATPNSPPVCFGWGEDHERAVGQRVVVREVHGA